ncbi:MAG: hypothetical protein NW241_22315 [Bacteroidia bacterium]|nr:hypothetical protein [Bacteroidia bacterium]
MQVVFLYIIGATLLIHSIRALMAMGGWQWQQRFWMLRISELVQVFFVLLALPVRSWFWLASGFALSRLMAVAELAVASWNSRRPPSILAPVNLAAVIAALCTAVTGYWGVFAVAYPLYWIASIWAGRRIVERVMSNSGAGAKI